MHPQGLSLPASEKGRLVSPTIQAMSQIHGIDAPVKCPLPISQAGLQPSRHGIKLSKPFGLPQMRSRLFRVSMSGAADVLGDP